MPAGAAILAPDAPATMGYERHLADGETVILAIRPSYWFLLLKRGGTLGGLVAVWLLMALVEAIGWVDFNLTPIALVLLIIVAAALLWLTIDRLSRLYLLTDKRILRISGVLTRTSVEIPLHKVTTVVLHRSVPERLTGTGSLLFTSAAAGGGPAGPGELVWFIIDHPARIVGTVRETLSRYGGGPPPASGTGAPPAGVLP